MSKVVTKKVGACLAPTEEEILEAYETAEAKGELTDVLGNKTEGFDLEYDPNEEKIWSFTDVSHMLRHLQGQVLTIVDAGYGEMEKTKFAKDLLKQAFLREAENVLSLGEEFRKAKK